MHGASDSDSGLSIQTNDKNNSSPIFGLTRNYFFHQVAITEYTNVEGVMQNKRVLQQVLQPFPTKAENS
ncbi:hypothetical protein OPV22_012039 [Ensete ventricosum]|uniref:Uncharacterized protein n=1 Tax=Ensete ventricosum TaxID=4639 RepID=A0AAV8R3Y6_ENSVE|nr:hypothetical protein OPV22_012039 [Ensete ventricosum]